MLSSGPAGCVAVQRRRGEGPVLSAVGREKGASTFMCTLPGIHLSRRDQSTGVGV